MVSSSVHEYVQRVNWRCSQWPGHSTLHPMFAKVNPDAIEQHIKFGSSVVFLFPTPVTKSFSEFHSICDRLILFNRSYLDNYY